MIRIKPQGRTGNILLQNVGASILSKKFDLCVERYFQIRNENILSINYHKSSRVNTNFVDIYDTIEHINHLKNDLSIDTSNSLSIDSLVNLKEIDFGLNMDCTFQVEEFVKKFKNEILEHFNLRYNSQKDNLFIHVRLGDVESVNPGINYYREAIESTKFNVGFISSDSLEHPMVKNLIQEYKLVPYIEEDPIQILNFAKDFDNLVLSKGTFSWWMAMLSKSKNIIFPKNDTPWYGNIFVFDDWKFIEIKK